LPGVILPVQVEIKKALDETLALDSSSVSIKRFFFRIASNNIYYQKF
jgi:hypothetical protein